MAGGATPDGAYCHQRPGGHSLFEQVGAGGERLAKLAGRCMTTPGWPADPLVSAIGCPEPEHEDDLDDLDDPAARSMVAQGAGRTYVQATR